MIKMNTILATLVALGCAQVASAENLLIKLASPASSQKMVEAMNKKGLKAEVVLGSWVEVSGNIKLSQFNSMLESSAIVKAQPNYKLNILKNPSFDKIKNNKALMAQIAKLAPTAAAGDNPEIPDTGISTYGADPLTAKQWGMKDIGVINAWKFNPNPNPIVVAVIDTGVDYTHEDLLPNLWRNTREIPNNGMDDDHNGFIDDTIGWDFESNDNKPYDLKASTMDMLTKGGNPGHGTHCAGNVAAAADNAKGIAGVAPKAKVMVIKFLGNSGGTTANAVKSIRYAVDNGAQILSNSWGSEGEDPKEQADNQALKDAIQYAQDRNVLFIAAAGNGHQGVGYDNDTDAKPGYPASYDNDNIISVAAIDQKDTLGTFSNWGKRTVDIAAPGVKVFSTTVGNKYDDAVIKIPFINSVLAYWDGTSMACPHVAGAAALYWSAHPTKNWKEVKDAIMNSAKPVAAYSNKLVTGGKLDVESLMKY